MAPQLVAVWGCQQSIVARATSKSQKFEGNNTCHCSDQGIALAKAMKQRALQHFHTSTECCLEFARRLSNVS